MSAVYISMDVITRLVIVPLSLETLFLTGPPSIFGSTVAIVPPLLDHREARHKYPFHHHPFGSFKANWLSSTSCRSRNLIT